MQLLLAFDSSICTMVQAVGVKDPLHDKDVCGTRRPRNDYFFLGASLRDSHWLMMSFSDSGVGLLQSLITDKYGPQGTRFGNCAET